MPLQTLARILEWGPASHNPENPFSVENTADAALSQIERGAEDARPDDN